MQYPELYQRTHDIDYFFRNSSDLRIYHVASNGFKVPDEIDMDINYNFQRAVYKKLRDDDYEHLPIYQIHNREEQDAQSYYESFNRMASLGFISCDAISDEEVVVVSVPMSDSGDMSWLEEEIFDLLPVIDVEKETSQKSFAMAA